MVWEYKLAEIKVEKKPTYIKVEVDEDDRCSVADHLGISSVNKLLVEFKVFRPNGGFLVEVHGHIVADVVQECVVSCDPVLEHIEEDFEAFFANMERAVLLSRKRKDMDLQNGAAEVEISEEREEPEPIIDGQIDLADVAMQFLSLALDSYPKADGVSYDGETDEDPRAEPAESRKNPFEALRQLKDL